MLISVSALWEQVEMNQRDLTYAIDVFNCQATYGFCIFELSASWCIGGGTVLSKDCELSILCKRVTMVGRCFRRSFIVCMITVSILFREIKPWMQEMRSLNAHCAWLSWWLSAYSSISWRARSELGSGFNSCLELVNSTVNCDNKAMSNVCWGEAEPLEDLAAEAFCLGL